MTKKYTIDEQEIYTHKPRRNYDRLIDILLISMFCMAVCAVALMVYLSHRHPSLIYRSKDVCGMIAEHGCND